MHWNDTFLDLFRKCLAKYQSGDQNYQNYYTEDDLAFLASIGYQPRELFDFVEDLADQEVPTESTALLIASVRRDYFHVVQKGQPSEKRLTRDELPSFGDELQGIAYLPRILAKARAKLRGELDPDIMFSCGGDRKFLTEHNLHPADFLRHVWAADDDLDQIVDFIRSKK